MAPASPASLSEALAWRYATKKFDSTRKIPAATWAALENALVLAPSSFGLQPWKFIVVETPETRAKLPGLSWGQTQPAESSHFVVFAARTDFGEADVDRFIDRLVEVRGGTREDIKGYRDVMAGFVARGRAAGTLPAWCDRQIYIALGQFMAAAAMLGIDACPMEGIDPAGYDAVLGLPAQGYRALVACAAGYRSADDKYAGKAKVRFKAEAVIGRA